jgi:hypothetical protein
LICQSESTKEYNTEENEKKMCLFCENKKSEPIVV